MGPLVFEPYLRPQIWGGRSLGKELGKTLPTDDSYGESWEVSGHPHHVSVVSEGPLKGSRLDELCKSHAAELFGDEAPKDGKFPLLIKLLDCQELLSVQVHPDDETANRIIPGERGKTEAWVVMQSAPEGEIFAGLRPGMDRATFQSHIDDGTTGDCLHRFHPEPGDCLFIQAGTVHTLGGGVLVAEVQQSSDATFRLFDWNRVGTDGKPRPLHIEQSLESIDFSAGPVSPVAPKSIETGTQACQRQRLVECKHFVLDRFRVSGPWKPKCDGMTIWMVIDGSATLSAEGFEKTLHAGQTVLLPASCPPVTWTPTGSSGIASLLGIALSAQSLP